MALTSIRSVRELEGLFVLAPERYDPRRRSLRSSSIRSAPLRSLVLLNRRTITASDAPDSRCLVFDTSDAQEGIVISKKQPLTVREIGSAKKIVEPKDVLISRLRPYLRQVAFVDRARVTAPTIFLCCVPPNSSSSAPPTACSIAFLVPFLLSDPVQKVLAASQEGGHHPRFNEAALTRTSGPGHTPQQEG